MSRCRRDFERVRCYTIRSSKIRALSVACLQTRHPKFDVAWFTPKSKDAGQN